MIKRPIIRRRAEEGAVAVELAVTLSALLFLILGAVQFGIVFWNWNSMLLAVEEAGRYAMLYNSTTFPGGPPGCAQTLAQCAVTWANQNLGSEYTITSSTGTDATGNPTLTFKATYTFDLITNFSLSRAIEVPVI
jgi:hypothetical protein